MYIGLDPSLTSFGAAVVRFDSEGNSTHETTALTSVACKGLQQRFARFRSLLGDLFAWLPDLGDSHVVAIEGYSYASRGAGVYDLGEFGGMLRDYLLDECDLVIEVPPNSLKKFMTGSGTSGKAAMAVAAYKRYGVEFATPDETDAFGLAMFGAAFINELNPQTAFQREAIETCRKKL